MDSHLQYTDGGQVYLSQEAKIYHKVPVRWISWIKAEAELLRSEFKQLIGF